jgi:hypothetical protein
MEKCDARTRAYKNGKTFDQCREIARKLCSDLEREITRADTVSWDKILQDSGHDELVYKLTLKYLRQNGYDIGNWKTPRVTKVTI